jgi:hypothetical protein
MPLLKFKMKTACSQHPRKAAAVSCLRKDGGEQVVEVDVPGEHEDARSIYNVEIYKKGRCEHRKGTGTTTKQTSF